MCPICLAVAGLFTALFRPWIHLRRGAAWRRDDARDA